MSNPFEKKIDGAVGGDEYKELTSSNFDMGRVRGIVNEMDSENSLGLIENHPEVAKLWMASSKVAESKREEFIRGVIRTLLADSSATVTTVLEDIGKKDHSP